MVSHLEKEPSLQGLKDAMHFEDCISPYNEILDFEPLPFDHPVYILFSSGTTGKPKCMVHSAGRVLIQHLKELMLHTNLQPRLNIFYNTTISWMMWNWLVSSLAVGATVVLYEGSPFHPSPTTFFDLIDKASINIFGIGAKYLEALEKRGIVPDKHHHLSSLFSILSTGSPLLPAQFDYVYNKIKSDVRLCSISGGSDIVSCFALGNPLLPIYRGELQCIGLGMNVKIFDEQGQPVINQKGELVCISPFPSMPVYFWNDPDGKKYQKAYFNKYPNVWAQGDYALQTLHGGLVIYGRSDTTLNPGGIRIGSAEIYQVLEPIEEITEAAVVGKYWQGDEKIILFVILHEDCTLTEDLINKIKNNIRSNLSPHHVPAKIITVTDIPRTPNNKISEIAVKKLINGENIDNLASIANPESLPQYANLQINFD
jgi:acetoacetyl-CoA synthetase